MLVVNNYAMIFMINFIRADFHMILQWFGPQHGQCIARLQSVGGS